jgi:hypothetical protein
MLRVDLELGCLGSSGARLMVQVSTRRVPNQPNSSLNILSVHSQPVVLNQMKFL